MVLENKIKKQSIVIGMKQQHQNKTNKTTFK